MCLQLLSERYLVSEYCEDFVSNTLQPGPVNKYYVVEIDEKLMFQAPVAHFRLREPHFQLWLLRKNDQTRVYDSCVEEQYALVRDVMNVKRVQFCLQILRKFDSSSQVSTIHTKTSTLQE